jgi:hypothetical protein
VLFWQATAEKKNRLGMRRRRFLFGAGFRGDRPDGASASLRET